MKSKIYALSVIAAFVLNAFGLILIGAPSAQAKDSGELVTLLPDSDLIVTLDTQRLMSQSLPQIMSANQPLLAKINQQIDDIKAKTGLDLRQFDLVTVGATAKQKSAGKISFEPLVLARGSFNPRVLVAAVKLASNGKYREEKIGERSIYVFTVKEIVAENKPDGKNSVSDKFFDEIEKGLTGEIAITNYNDTTLAFGTTAKVRELLEGKTRAAKEITDPIYQNPNALMNFSARLPNGLADFFKIDNDELGKSLRAIRQVSGNFDVTENNAALAVKARTQTADQARQLQDTVEVLQMFGKSVFGDSKSADKQVYARLAENAQISRSTNELSIKVAIPQSDIDVLIGKK